MSYQSYQFVAHHDFSDLVSYHQTWFAHKDGLTAITVLAFDGSENLHQQKIKLYLIESSVKVTKTNELFS